MQRHFTSTAFVINSKNQVLLLWHRRLQRWMPPGGHVDENETPQDAAKRECKEETNLDVEIMGSAELTTGAEPEPDLFALNPAEGRMLKKPIAMLLENIPESKERGEPAHEHMDFLYVARPLNEDDARETAAEESDGMRWFTKKEIEELDEEKEIFSNVKRYILLMLKA